MDKMVTQFQKEKMQKHEAIRQDFAGMVSRGGAKTAIYEELGKKYGYTAHRIWEIVNGREK